MKPNGTNIILSKENESLKQKIKDLQKQNDALSRANFEFLEQIRAVQTIMQSIEYLKQFMDKKHLI